MATTTYEVELTKDHAVPVGEDGYQAYVTLMAGDIVYYGGQQVSPSFNNGLLSSPGASVQLGSPPTSYLFSPSQSSAKVLLVPNLPAAAGDAVYAPAPSGGDDTLTLQASLNAVPPSGGMLVLQPGTYFTSSPLSLSRNGMRIVGAGRVATTIKNSTTDVFSIASTISYLKMESLLVWSAVGGGNCFIQQSGAGVGQSVFFDTAVQQDNPAQSLWQGDTAGVYLDNLWLGCALQHVTTATVPGFNFVSNSANINTNTWQRCRCTWSGNYFFHIECAAASTWNLDNVFRDINAEVMTGGFATLLSAYNTQFDNVACYDLAASSTTNHMFRVDKSSTGLTSRLTSFRNIRRQAGALGGGMVDIYAPQSARTLIENCSTTGSDFTIDLVNQTGLILNMNPTGFVLNNGGAAKIIDVASNETKPYVIDTYSASITPDSQAGLWHRITVTDGNAITINAPTNPPDSAHTREIIIEVLNSSGGAMGAITWNAKFIFATGAWANPANGKFRYAKFEWNGGNVRWICTSVATADY